MYQIRSMDGKNTYVECGTIGRIIDRFLKAYEIPKTIHGAPLTVFYKHDDTEMYLFTVQPDGEITKINGVSTDQMYYIRWDNV